ncbi:hypothetical protein G8T76_10750 [Clostridium botulinum C/D]|uniref:hypothetical protein n=1 Tax=Clostridium botulinum TaxID=1491 RepID=UPI0003192BAF|nr:hypothetical protein [Clostridium botulinum]KEI02882.1 hypothetical protein Y848_06315 [Clostridium botulinum C/D str. Sp77]KOA76888.1 hypothetical protein ADU78_05375 [Clostridium botulinum]KOA80933.1 hypothetical protein ADU77_00105 [Clostridium botulinum]KOA88959.1 hypothetical protein ADU75_00835 [Clostridium botulinum]KOC31828.1 hypothetical protein ADU83_11905 [Clostridium botulinum]
MNRKEFDSLDRMQQIEYINKELGSGKSLTELSEKINISRSTIRKRFKKLGYEFNQELNKYICDKHNIDITHKTESDRNMQGDKSNLDMVHMTSLREDTSIDSVGDKHNIDITLEKLNDNADKILRMLDWWENRDSKINIDLSKLNNFNKETKHRSFNVNAAILNEFTDFCNSHREYTQVDLLSAALLEFIKKYK